MTKKEIDLPRRPISQMRASDMDGSPSAALMALFRMASDIGLELEQINVKVSTTADQMSWLPEKSFAELRDRYAKFIADHDQVVRNILTLADRTTDLAKALTETKERESKRFDELMGANGKLLSALEKTSKAHAIAVRELKELLDLPLSQLFRAWLARRFTQ